MTGILDVAADQKTAPAGTFDESLSFLCILVFAVVAHEDIGSLASEGERHGTADTAISTGNDGFLILETPGAPVAVLAVVGRRIHQGALSRHGLLLLRKGGGRKWTAHRLFLHRSDAALNLYRTFFLALSTQRLAAEGPFNARMRYSFPVRRW